MSAQRKLDVHHRHPESFGDRLALAFVKFLRVIADAFFAKRYGHRAVVLENSGSGSRNGWRVVATLEGASPHA